jgi:tetratricopeptide (TPR) repeat protein
MGRYSGLIIVIALAAGCSTNPNATSPPAEVELTNGQRALEKGSYDSAVAWLGSAIAREPNNALAYRLRAKANYLKASGMTEPKDGLGAERAADSPEKAFDRAIADASKAIELDPKDAEAYLVRAQARHGKRGKGKGSDEDVDSARADCKKALELAPEGPLADEAKKLQEQLGSK